VASRLVWLATACALAGCSLSLDGPDPQRPKSRPPECDTGKGLVTLDAVVGTGFTLGGVIGIDNGSAEAAAIPLVIGGFFLLAALHGNNTVNACRNAMAVFAEQGGPEPAPRMATKRPAAKQKPPPAPPPEPEPEPAVADDPPPQPQPQQQQPQAQPQQQPPAPPVKPAAKPAPLTVPRPAPPPADAADPWRDFWKELP
jgi:hypothetical protein